MYRARHLREHQGVLVLDSQSQDLTEIEQHMTRKVVYNILVRSERRFLLGLKAEASAPEIG